MSHEAPRVWVLLGKGAGGNAQMRALAEALGWPYEAKQIVWNRFDRIPTLLLRGSLLTLDREASSPLRPPWPDVVIAGSRRSAPIALWIKRQAPGRTKLVHLMHTQAPLSWFDLVITTAQYRLPARPNVLHNNLPLNRIPEDRLARGAAEWRPKLEGLARPLTALLVGGNSSSYELDPETAVRLGRLASEQVRAEGGALLVSTSARTPAAAADALIAALDCPHFVYRWRKDDPENPYFGYLALADRFIVTVDSASMPAEVCATGKPVFLFEWPPRRGFAFGPKGLLRRWAEHRGDGRIEPRGLAAKSFDRVVYLGLLKPRRDFDAYFRTLKERGLVTALGRPAPSLRAGRLDDMERAVARVRQLVVDRKLEAPPESDRDEVGCAMRTKGRVRHAHQR